ncbi:MAG: hypothetical protein WAN11_06685 [Syntrophobacteraceae bacterium]
MNSEQTGCSPPAHYSLDLQTPSVPARRKKLRVKVDCRANVHEDGSILVWPTRQYAEEHLAKGTIARIHIKRQVKEGEGGVGALVHGAYPYLGRSVKDTIVRRSGGTCVACPVYIDRIGTGRACSNSIDGGIEACFFRCAVCPGAAGI